MTATAVTDVDVTQVKEELHRLIDQLTERKTFDALDHVRWLLSDEEETLTEAEREQVERDLEEIRHGHYVTLDEMKRQLAGCTLRFRCPNAPVDTRTSSIRPPNGASWTVSKR